MPSHSHVPSSSPSSLTSNPPSKYLVSISILLPAESSKPLISVLLKLFHRSRLPSTSDDARPHSPRPRELLRLCHQIHLSCYHIHHLQRLRLLPNLIHRRPSIAIPQPSAATLSTSSCGPLATFHALPTSTTAPGNTEIHVQCTTNSRYGYQFNAVNGTSVYAIYAQSPTFFVTGQDCVDKPIPGVGVTTTCVKGTTTI